MARFPVDGPPRDEGGRSIGIARLPKSVLELAFGTTSAVALSAPFALCGFAQIKQALAVGQVIRVRCSTYLQTATGTTSVQLGIGICNAVGVVYNDWTSFAWPDSTPGAYRQIQLEFDYTIAAPDLTNPSPYIRMDVTLNNATAAGSAFYSSIHLSRVA